MRVVFIYALEDNLRGTKKNLSDYSWGGDDSAGNIVCACMASKSRGLFNI